MFESEFSSFSSIVCFLRSFSYKCTSRKHYSNRNSFCLLCYSYAETMSPSSTKESQSFTKDYTNYIFHINFFVFFVIFFLCVFCGISISPSSTKESQSFTKEPQSFTKDCTCNIFLLNFLCVLRLGGVV
jgi:hypothetical protein